MDNIRHADKNVLMTSSERTLKKPNRQCIEEKKKKGRNINFMNTA